MDSCDSSLINKMKSKVHSRVYDSGIKHSSWGNLAVSAWIHIWLISQPTVIWFSPHHAIETALAKVSSKLQKTSENIWYCCYFVTSLELSDKSLSWILSQLSGCYLYFRICMLGLYLQCWYLPKLAETLLLSLYTLSSEYHICSLGFALPSTCWWFLNLYL